MEYSYLILTYLLPSLLDFKLKDVCYSGLSIVAVLFCEQFIN